MNVLECRSILLQSHFPSVGLIATLVVSFKAITALIELESLQRELSQRVPTRQDAEFFQPRLGALIALTSGGILRPGSVSGLYMCTFSPPPLRLS